MAIYGQANSSGGFWVFVPKSDTPHESTSPDTPPVAAPPVAAPPALPIGTPPETVRGITESSIVAMAGVDVHAAVEHINTNWKEISAMIGVTNDTQTRG